MLKRTFFSLLLIFLFSLFLRLSVEAVKFPSAGLALKNAVLRTGPGADFDRVGIIPEGAKIDVLSNVHGWCKVKCGSFIFFTEEDDIKLLNVRYNSDLSVVNLIKISTQDNLSRVAFRLTDICPYSVTEEDDSVTVVFYNTLSGLFENIHSINENDIKYAERVILYPFASCYKIKLKHRLWGYDAGFRDKNFVISFKPAPEIEKNSLKGAVVVLDAGHGGADPGAVGILGLNEKTVNLKLVMKLKELLQNDQAKVILTRSGDFELAPDGSSAYDELKARVDIGYLENATIFISVHNNAMPDIEDARVATGTYTYFYRNMSMSLAECITKELSQVNNENKAAYINRSFHVIRQTYMPSVLIEVTFISNPNEEKKLLDENYINSSAEAVFNGIKNFFKNK